MKCKKCGYEPSLKEIQIGGECPGCQEAEHSYQQKIDKISITPPKPRPQEVVVVDLNMSFMSMVIFMIKWALASIPALVALILIGVFVFSFVAGFMGYSSPPPRL